MWPRTIADIAKRWASKAGLDHRTIGAHSLRRGCITSMHDGGATIEAIMQHSRHKTVGIALGYIEAKRATLNPALRALKW
jgi:integrase